MRHGNRSDAICHRRPLPESSTTSSRDHARARSIAAAALLVAGCGSRPGTTTMVTSAPSAATVEADPVHLTPPPPSRLALTDGGSCVVEGDQVICWGAGHAPHVEDSLGASATVAGGVDRFCSLDSAGTSLRCTRGPNPFSGPLLEPVESSVAIELDAEPLLRTSDGRFVRPGSTTPLEVPSNTVRVREAGETTCVLSETGALTCTTPDQAPVVIEEVLDFDFESAALCLLRRDAVECAPLATWRRHGAPERVTGTAGAARIVAGSAHFCVLAEDGTVLCAGTNERGELGRGNHDLRANDLAPVVDVRGATEIAAGAHHTCARTVDGVRCWGDDGGAQVSGEQVTYASTAMTGATSLASGWSHTCALGAERALWCWGNGRAGQLGDGTARDRVLPTPAQLPGIGAITEIAAGPESTCVLSGGRVACFGGTARDRQEVPDLDAISDATHIGGGGSSVWVVRAGGEVAPFRAASGARLEADRRQAGPGRIPAEVAQVVGDGRFVCALDTDGHVWGWGSDFGGEVGDGGDGVREEPTRVIAPIEMPATAEGREHLSATCDRRCGTMAGVSSLTSSGRSTCAVLASGRIACWGEDGHDRFAEGVRFARRPVLVEGVEHARAACLGLQFMCVLRDDGTVRCRGDGSAGAERNAELAALDHVTQISCGGTHACALREDATVHCWGESRGGRLGSEAIIRGRAVSVALP